MGQLLGPETDTFRQFLVQIVFFPEFWPIEKEKNNLNKFWIMYEFNRKKKSPFEHRLNDFKIIRARKLKECVKFWAQFVTGTGSIYHIKQDILI